MAFTTFFYMLLILSTTYVSARCPEFSGSFIIQQDDLYPESAAWDPTTCRLYLSSMYNSTLAIYNPYTKSVDIANLPGISHPGTATYTEYHLDGVDYDAKSGYVYVAASSASAFTSILKEEDGTLATDYSNANYTGPNHVVVFDPHTQRVVADVDTSAAQREYHRITGHLTNAFQDMAEIQSTGDSYAIATFGNSIVKISSGSYDARLWYAPSHYNKTYGFGGIVSIGDKLVISDAISGGLVTFDTQHDHKPHPTYVPLQNLPSDYRPGNADGLYLPQKYGGKVLLWSDDYNGTSVYGSDDGWTSAHFLGLILNDDPKIEGGLTTDSFDIGDSIFILTQEFAFTLPAPKKHNFIFFDITAEVDEVVKGSFVDRE
ncbi:hypothetical protein LTR09_012138 [Extremus antarcticus]|uniref:Uncharacterized protein n=1 Tax=Extremus antarcticus TaxID=702011 RepID=A0AAJ0G716_9PEZI|nr:hypothetical protein LTR09_012138 [Extremus antarcticus]